MKMFRIMVDDYIRIGLENDESTRIKLTKLCYHQLARYKIYSVYKLYDLSHAGGILANRKKFLSNAAFSQDSRMQQDHHMLRMLGSRLSMAC